MELVLVWMAFLSRRWKIVCFFVVTGWQIVVISTANYTFLNYLVLSLAVFLVDDVFLQRFLPSQLRMVFDRDFRGTGVEDVEAGISCQEETQANSHWWSSLRAATFAVALTWVFYATTVPLVQMSWRDAPLPQKPVIALEPFRIANQYGLFAVMTPHRYEIEFQ